MQLEAYFPYRLAVAAEAFSRKLIDVYGRAYGLSREEWRLLLLLADAGQLTSLELSRRTTLDKVQVSRAAQKLETKGLITRSVSEIDRRLRIYTCTKEGQKFFAEVFPKVEAQASDILSSMDADDRTALETGINALARTVAAHAEKPAEAKK